MLLTAARAHCKLRIIQLHMNDINQCIALIDEKLEHYRLKYAAIIKHLTTMIDMMDEADFPNGSVNTESSRTLEMVMEFW